MRILSRIRIRAASGACFCLAVLVLAPALSRRASAADASAGIRFGYHSFTESSMKDGYSGAPFLSTDLIMTWGHHGASIELGYLSSEGEPIRVTSEWRVTSTSLSMRAVPFSVSYRYYVVPYDRSRRLTPYAGAGLGAFVGREKIGARGTTLLKAWDGWLWGARGSMAGHLLIGARVAAWKGLDGVVEARWILGGTGWNVDLEDAEEAPTFDEYLYRLVERPDFDFSGWSVSIGLCW